MTLSTQKPGIRNAARRSFFLLVSIAWWPAAGAAEVGAPLPDRRGF
jgi:hypothetical protein